MAASDSFAVENKLPEVTATFSSVDCAMFVDGLPAVVELDVDEQKRVLNFDDRTLTLDFPFVASSIEFDRPSGSFFVASGVTVYQIQASDFSIPQLLTPNCGPMLRSSIIGLSDSIILGNRGNIHMWARESLTGGRSPCTGSIDAGIPSVTSLAPADAGFAAASRNHHAIHIFSDEGYLTRSCIGHSAGVTALASSGGPLFVSGSADLTARIWDLRQVAPVAQLQQHIGPLTVVRSAVVDGIHYLLTGGEDRIVRCWDMRGQRPFFEARTGTGIPIAMQFAPDGKIAVITKEMDSTCADGRHFARIDQVQLFGASPNLALKFDPMTV
jgi:WD40 repeat protein